MLGARQYISRVYKSAMGGTDMERHHRGWKETRLAEDRLLRDLLPGKRQKRSRLPPSSRCPRLTRDNRPPFLPPPIYAL